MEKSLREFMQEYKPDKIQLLIGNHLISINRDVDGQDQIIEAFLNYSFNFGKFDEFHRFLLLIK